MGTDASDDYYALLGIQADISEAELRRAWRRLALKWHPDRAGPSATATFQKLSEAYNVLSDPIARSSYDRRRGTGARSSNTASAAPATAKPRTPGKMLSRAASRAVPSRT